MWKFLSSGNQFFFLLNLKIKFNQGLYAWPQKNEKICFSEKKAVKSNSKLPVSFPQCKFFRSSPSHPEKFREEGTHPPLYLSSCSRIYYVPYSPLGCCSEQGRDSRRKGPVFLRGSPGRVGPSCRNYVLC